MQCSFALLDLDVCDGPHNGLLHGWRLIQDKFSWEKKKQLTLSCHWGAHLPADGTPLLCDWGWVQHALPSLRWHPWLCPHHPQHPSSRHHLQWKAFPWTDQTVIIFLCPWLHIFQSRLFWSRFFFVIPLEQSWPFRMISLHQKNHRNKQQTWNKVWVSRCSSSSAWLSWSTEMLGTWLLRILCLPQCLGHP